ncbi:unnamed protein product [Coccothraustes coccothraustes]
MQALRKAEDAYLEVSGAKGRCRTVFSRRRALESTGTCTMLSRRRSHFIASANRRARPLLRREERSRTTLAFSARTHQGQYLSSRLPFDRTERFLWREVLHNVAAHFARPPATLDCKLSRALESTGTGTMLSGRRNRFFAFGGRRAWPMLRCEERSRTILAFYAHHSNSSRTEPRFGKHRHRHNAQCVKKPRLRFHQPESAAAVET